VSLERGNDQDPQSVVQITSEAELGTLPALSPGRVAERRAAGGEVWRYICVGRPSPAVRAVLGWHQENVWLRKSELDYMVLKRPDLITHPPDAIAAVLENPVSVHQNPRHVGTIYFLGDGERLRTAGLLQSTGVRFMDLVVERRPVLGGSFLRTVHFSPTRQNRGGRQLWP
jgi:hypothetical protein